MSSEKPQGPLSNQQYSPNQQLEIRVSTLEGMRIFIIDNSFLDSLASVLKFIGSKYDSSGFRGLYVLFYKKEDPDVLQLLKTEEEFLPFRSRCRGNRYDFYISEEDKDTLYVPRIKKKSVVWEPLYPHFNNCSSGATLSTPTVFSNSNPFGNSSLSTGKHPFTQKSGDTRSPFFSFGETAFQPNSSPFPRTLWG